MSSWEEEQALQIAKELESMADRLDELEDYAIDMGWPAMEHKVQEARGPLRSAQEAMEQYADGTLTAR